MFHRIRTGWALPILLIAVHTGMFAQSGPYSPAADSAGSDAISKDSIIISGWVTNVQVFRGFQDVSQGGPLASVGDESLATGKADGQVVSLGDSGVALITLDEPLADHQGVDFAVFENGLYDMANGGYFLELAFVEVSSNGTDFYRIPNASLTDTQVQVGTFGTLDPTMINGLAGKYRTGYGTPFDLSVLDTVAGLDLSAVTHIRIVDVIGSVQDTYASYDSHGRKVNDPWPTPFGSSGFDLDAVALIDETLLSIPVAEKQSIEVYPNPATGSIRISSLGHQNIHGLLEVFDIFGRRVYAADVTGRETFINIDGWPEGVYLIKVGSSEVTKLIKQ